MNALPLTLTHLPSSALRLTGADRLDFVQGQMTNNLKAAPTPGMVPACFLSPKGQIELFARIYKRESDIYLHLAEGQAAQLAARFRKYIIFDQVEVQDLSAELATLHVWSQAVPGWDASGPDVQHLQFSEGAPSDGQPNEGEPALSVLAGRVNRSGEAGLDLHYLRRRESVLLSALGAEERSVADLEAARVRAGISDAAADGWAGYLPQEVGLESAMNYRKGCYVGQEIMARLEARGNTRYHLAQLSGEHLPPHSEVTLGGKVVGRSGASSGETALVRIRKDLPEDAELEVGGVSARLRPGAEPAP